MPADYYAGDGKAAYITALRNEKGIYNPAVKGKTIDLAQTYTNQFVESAS